MENIIRRPVIVQTNNQSNPVIESKTEPETVSNPLLLQQQLIAQQQNQLKQAQLKLQQEQEQFKQQKIQFQQMSEQLKQQAINEGLEQGRQQAQEELDSHISRLAELQQQLQTQYAQCLTSLEKQLLPIFYTALCRFFIQWSPSKKSLMAFCQQATSQVMDETIISIRLNPIDYQLLQSNDAVAMPDNQFKFIADSKIKGGGCVIETELGYLDAQLVTQFEQLKDALLARYR